MPPSDMPRWWQWWARCRSTHPLEVDGQIVWLRCAYRRGHGPGLTYLRTHGCPHGFDWQWWP